jgi:hypothetical protein
MHEHVKINHVLKGVASTMDICPSEDEPVIKEKNLEKRLRRSWERTGQAIQRSMDRFACEQSSQ